MNQKIAEMTPEERQAKCERLMAAEKSWIEEEERLKAEGKLRELRTIDIPLSDEVKEQVWRMCERLFPELTTDSDEMVEVMKGQVGNGITEHDHHDLEGAVGIGLGNAMFAGFIVGWQCCKNPDMLIFEPQVLDLVLA